MTWKASAGSPPWAAGSASGSMTLWNSTTEPGQPWVISKGRASGDGLGWWMKWMSKPSMVVLNWAKRFIRAWRADQS